MSSRFEQITAELAAEGPRRFARWDGDLFQEIARAYGWTFRYRYKDKRGAPEVFRAWATLLQEAVGRGQIAGLPEDDLREAMEEHSLQSWLLGALVPGGLYALPAARQLPALARAWNLLEGLERDQPAWVVRYVLSRLREDLESIEELEDFLALALEPVLTPPKPARFKGPFAVAVVDAREAVDGLLPGELYLAAPGVMCVADRRDPGLCTALFLRRGEATALMGRVPRLPPYEERAVAGVEVGPGAVTVRGARVPLPRLAHPHSHAASAAGFVVVSALDSQRLWVVETP